MENKIYLITATSGCYDDWNKFTVGIATTPQQADEIKNEFIAKTKECKSRYSPDEELHLEEELQIEFDNYEGNIREDNKRLNDYWDWKYTENSLNINDNSCGIEEIELNKMIYNFD